MWFNAVRADHLESIGINGWNGMMPIRDVYLLFKGTNSNLLFFYIMFIPIFDLIGAFYIGWRLGKGFGFSTIGSILNGIFYPLVGRLYFPLRRPYKGYELYS